MQFNIEQINNDWTLFIDRDGVINHEKKDDYIKTVEEFKFYDGVLAALAMLSGFFKTIVLVTNQKGVGRGLMTEADLAAIHAFMLAEIQQAGGRIDAIFYCTDTAAESPNRKPNPGMAFQAKQQFPHINFQQSVMVG
ncbi:MAG: D-glycero-alpha-D-manno-heptose-1,7-bisphosphate 7-phosphatase, partial [Chitinophagaceae bacterium]